MRQYDLEIDKYWMTQSGYFRLATTVKFGMNIVDAKLLLCHGVPDQIKDKKIPMIKYNYRKVYDYFDNPFSVDSGTSDLTPPPPHSHW